MRHESPRRVRATSIIPKLALILAGGACLLSICLLATRPLRSREEGTALTASPPAVNLTKTSEPETVPSTGVLPSAPLRREAAIGPNDVPQIDAESSMEATSLEAESAIQALAKAQEFAASFPSEGPLELSKSTAELAFIQTCVGHILRKANRGIDVEGDAEIIRLDAADDEAKFFHDGRMFIVSRGEFPIYDEARDRLASDIRQPRSPEYYEEYHHLFVQALESLGVKEGTR